MILELYNFSVRCFEALIDFFDELEEEAQVTDLGLKLWSHLYFCHKICSALDTFMSCFMGLFNAAVSLFSWNDH